MTLCENAAGALYIVKKCVNIHDQTNSSKKQAITAVLMCNSFYICSTVPQFNIHSSNAAEKKIHVILSMR